MRIAVLPRKGGALRTREHVETGLVLGACGVMLFLRLGGVCPLTTPNEGLYGQAAREMLWTGDWIIPHINTVPYLEKPPLLYWLAALCMMLFGETALAARLPSAVAGAATVLLLLRAGRRMRPGSGLGAFSGVVLASCLGFAFMSRQVMFDALLTCFMTWALVAWWEAGEERRLAASVQIWLALALAVMSKGPIGLGLPVAVMLATALVTHGARRLRVLGHPAGLAVFLLVAAPWHILAAMRCKEFAWFYFVNEQFLRFRGVRWPPDFPHLSVPTLLGVTFCMALPWAALAFVGARNLLASRGNDPARAAEAAFLLCWTLVPIAFFSASACRANYYLLPILPPLALIVGQLWDARPDRAGTGPRRRRLAAPLAFLALVLMLGWLWAVQDAHSGRHEDGSSLLGACTAWMMVAGLIGATVLALRGRRRAALVAVAVGAFLMWGAAAVLAPALLHLTGPADAARLIADSATAAAPAVAISGRLEDSSSLVFCLPRRLLPVYVVNGRTGGDMEFGSRYPQVDHLFITSRDLARMAAARRVLFATGGQVPNSPPGLWRALGKRPPLTIWESVPRPVTSPHDLRRAPRDR